MEDNRFFYNFNRMTSTDFEKLICITGAVVSKDDVYMINK